jgi:tetratricopeptide (TPR) repeat protein
LILLGMATLLRAQNDPVQFQAEYQYDTDFHTNIVITEKDVSPYHVALVFYKTGHYDNARTFIDEAEKEKPGDPATEILKARILTELDDFAGAKKVLESLNGNPSLTPALDQARTLAFGDLCLRERSFDEAAKFYESLLSQKPNDPDLMLKVVYTRVGASDLLDAAKYASRLKPFDPAVDPLDPQHPGNPSYYFAKAAIAQATGNAQEAEDDIQTARTLYGVTITNRYLKTYLEVFASSGKNPASDITPPPLIKPTPTGSNP